MHDIMMPLQLNNLELAVNLAKRGNLPGAENLVSNVCYLDLFATKLAKLALKLPVAEAYQIKILRVC